MDISRRIAVVSNFGASGYAGHMVVEEHSSTAPSTISLSIKDAELPFMISAKDRSRWKISRLVGWGGCNAGAFERVR
jgi:acyl transferase domain-containing protein